MKRFFSFVVATVIVATTVGQNFTSQARVDQAFCGSSVIVVLDQNHSGINKVHQFGNGRQDATFGNLNIQYIQDLTHIPKETEDIQGLTLLNTETFQQILLLRLPHDDKQNVLDVIEQLRFTPGVYFAEPNYFIEVTSVFPNDPFFGSQWGMTSIQAPEAWAVTTGSSDIKVALIDIGFQGHNDLNANWDFTHAWCFFTNQALTSGNLGNTTPSVGWHGNHVAGIIGAVGDNNIGVAGVSWSVSLVPFEVFVTFLNGNPVGSGANQVSAMTRIIANNIPVVNMSMGGGDSQAMRAAIQNYRGLFVWAAGNSASNIDNTVGPNMGNRITVGAHDPNNARASFSCYGDRAVDIWAPGTTILSTTLNNAHQNAQGTSMAAPHVAGVAALMLSINPELTGVHLKELLLEGALPITIVQPSTNAGQHLSLRLNALGAVEALSEDIMTAPVFQSFEETADNELPDYWRHSAGPIVWKTTENYIESVTGVVGASGDTEPRTGDRQMVRTWHNTGHFAWTFSEAVRLSADTTYIISFWYKAPGFTPTGAFDNFRVQIGRTRSLTGTGINAQMQGATTVLTSQNRRVSNWTRAYIQFRPTSGGPHFLGFHCRTVLNGGWMISIDDISITAIRNIVLSEVGAHIFPSAILGYEPQTPHNVTVENITNTPTSELSVALSGANASNFTLSTATIPSIANSETASFTVVPNTGLPIGVYTATVTVTGDNGTFAEFDLRFIVSEPTSIGIPVETGHAPSLQVFPNPITDKLRIVIPDLFANNPVEIFDMNGQRVFLQHVETGRAPSLHDDNTIVINISHLPNGPYIIRIGQKTARIIKQ